jgi:hypothetical protein
VEGAVHYIQRHFGLAHSHFGSEQEFDETPDLLAGQLSEERSPLFSYRQSDGVALDNWRLFLLCRAGTTGGRRVVLDVEVQAGNQTASLYAQPGLWRFQAAVLYLQETPVIPGNSESPPPPLTGGGSLRVRFFSRLTSSWSHGIA